MMAPNGNFYFTEPKTIKLAHSLLSIAKWEARQEPKRAFLGPHKKTQEQLADYILCMAITPMDDEALELLTEENMADIEAYMSDNACATYHYDEKTPGKAGAAPAFQSVEVLREQIYYYGLPESCEKWHLNRLVSQLRTCAKYEAERMGGGKKLPGQGYGRKRH
jgi:hypothetical protein